MERRSFISLISSAIRFSGCALRAKAARLVRKRPAGRRAPGQQADCFPFRPIGAPAAACLALVAKRPFLWRNLATVETGTHRWDVRFGEAFHSQPNSRESAKGRKCRLVKNWRRFWKGQFYAFGGGRGKTYACRPNSNMLDERDHF